MRLTATIGRLRRAALPGRSAQGQSLAEFTLVVPVLLLILLVGIDFGRVYLGWINLQNMTRIAANYAANNATSIDLTAYANQIASDATATNCPLAPGQPAPPEFSDTDGNLQTHDIGDRVSVTLVCRFHV